jgi:hypothetical protein
MEWQRGVTAAAESFAGYLGTDVYPPSGAPEDQWVVVVYFDDQATLERWLESPIRDQWVQKLRAEVGDFELTTVPGGFGAWFAGLTSSRGGALPPSWKMALTVLLGLYPTVMLLTLLVGPHTSQLGLALSMLIGNALSVTLLQWAVMPALTSLLGRWLRANRDPDRYISIGGLVLILLLLGGLLLVFRQVQG